MESRVWLKLRLLLWKNRLVRQRHWLLTAFEICAPVSLCLLTLLLFSMVRSDTGSVGAKVFEAQDFSSTGREYMLLYYAPNTSFVDRLMSFAHDKVSTKEFVGFRTELDMLKYIENKTSKDSKSQAYTWQVAAVVFDDREGTPETLKYRIRTFKMDDRYKDAFPSDSFQDQNARPYLRRTNFAAIQHAVDMAFIDILAAGKNDSVPDVRITLQQMPEPSHPNMQLDQMTKAILPIMVTMGYVLVMMNVLKRILEEKSTGMKELMKMMGLEAWMSWLGWFVYSMAISTISTGIVAGVCVYGLGAKLPPIIPRCDFWMFWLFLLCYCTSMLLFAFAVSNLFDRPAIGTAASLGIWCVLSTVSSMLVKEEESGKASQTKTVMLLVRAIAMLVPNTSLRMGFNALLEWELQGGLQWGREWQRPVRYGRFPTMGCVLIMFVIECAVLALLTWYLENVRPGRYGVARPWYFPLSRDYWKCGRIASAVDDIPTATAAATATNDDSEKVPVEKVATDARVGISVRELRKRFGDKEAVRGLTLDMYEGQISVLLGHNGAGKTTTMNVITALTAATSGRVLVAGKDVAFEKDAVRRHLGLCPQFDVHFVDLTTLEHVMFFAVLRGARTRDCRAMALGLLRRLHIEEVADKKPHQLSGGMRRKLSLAMASAGEADTLILDEPTSGMDPEARRDLWDFLLSMRGDRTILLTTHYMEEADVLGDRIAIMHDGQLLCCGSPMFLKSLYGTGHVLTLLLKEDAPLDPIEKAVRHHVPDALTKTSSPRAVAFALPSHDTSALSHLFQSLEDKATALGVTNVGVSVTTMEEVFVRVGQIAGERDGRAPETGAAAFASVASDDGCLLAAVNGKRKEGRVCCLYAQRLAALLAKRAHYVRRCWISQLIGLLMPIGMLLLTLFVARPDSVPGTGSKGDGTFGLPLNLDLYSHTHVLYSSNGEGQVVNVKEKFRELTEERKVGAVHVLNVTEALLKAGDRSYGDYERGYVVAAEMRGAGHNRLELNGLYGQLAYHSVPVVLNLLTNAVARSIASEARIVAINNPLPSAEEMSQGSSSMDGLARAYSWMFFLPATLTMLVSTLISFPQEERSSGSAHLQMMAGAAPHIYWLAQFAFDALVYSAFVLLALIGLVAVDCRNAFGNEHALFAFAVLALFLGAALLPLAYMLTLRRRRTPATNSFLLILLLLIGTVAAFFYVSLALFKSTIAVTPDIATNATATASNGFGSVLSSVVEHTLFAVLPLYTYAHAVFTLVKHASDVFAWRTISANPNSSDVAIKCIMQPNPCCSDIDSSDCRRYLSYFGDGDQHVSGHATALLLQALVYALLLLLFESGWTERLWTRVSDALSGWCERRRNKRRDDDVDEAGAYRSGSEDEDEGVVEERRRVDRVMERTIPTTVDDDKDALLVHRLEKRYGRVRAVRGVSWGVRAGECFGLLGVNGAGKSSTFRMVTGETWPTAGDARCADASVVGVRRRAYLRRIGYCPQENALTPQLSAHQMLLLYARLRAVPWRVCPQHADAWAIRCNVDRSRGVPCGRLSGGNRRKLSLAVALIGGSPVAALDEPTCGVDPTSRRSLWRALSEARSGGRSLVLTTHAMDECEDLCDRLAILVRGRLRCIGPVAALKARFGRGLTLALRLDATSDYARHDQNVAKLDADVRSVLAECTLSDKHAAALHYRVGGATVAAVFAAVEKLKPRHPILLDYTVSDATLEQVFLALAREDRDAQDRSLRRSQTRVRTRTRNVPAAAAIV